MTKARLLVVDDERDMLDVCTDVLSKIGDVEVSTESEGEQAVRRLAGESFDLILTDIRMPRVGGLEIVEAARERDPDIPVIVFTAYPSVETAVEAMKLGATDYLSKPFLPEDLRRLAARLLETRRLQEENRLLERRLGRERGLEEIVGTSAAIQSVREAIRRVASVDTDVLILGETGTGKELVARAIHKLSGRSKDRFVPVDGGAIPEDLLESEFFGHEKGAFTGAHARSLGLLEFADRGTFFLDEIAELPPRLQAKLLRVLQERRIRRVGGRDEVDVDVRILAATSRDLGEEMKKGRFREDLYYRINVARIELPPLRERPDDVPVLLDALLGRFSDEMGQGPIHVTPDVADVLAAYHWPGNVRELQNVLKRAIAFRKQPTLRIEDLPDEVVSEASERPGGLGDSGMGFQRLREERVATFERGYLTDLLESCGGDVAASARQARLPRGTLYRLLKRHGIEPTAFRRGGG